TRVAPPRHEADVLTIGLVGHRQAEAAREVAYFGLAVAAEGEAQPLKLRARGCEQEVALVALRVAGTVGLGADGPLSQFDGVAGGCSGRWRGYRPPAREWSRAIRGT